MGDDDQHRRRHEQDDETRRRGSADRDQQRLRRYERNGGRDRKRDKDWNRRRSRDRRSRDRRSRDRRSRDRRSRDRRSGRDERRSRSPESERRKSQDRGRGGGKAPRDEVRERERNRDKEQEKNRSDKSESYRRRGDRSRYDNTDRRRNDDEDDDDDDNGYDDDGSRDRRKNRGRERERGHNQEHGKVANSTADVGRVHDRRMRHSSRDGDPRRKRQAPEENPSESLQINRGGSPRRRSRSPWTRRNGPLPTQANSFALSTTATMTTTMPSDGALAASAAAGADKPKEKPSYKNTGLLAAASNAVAQADGTTVTLKYHEPAEARKPAGRDQWRMFVFKGDEVVDNVDLGTRSCWLVGREERVVDMAAIHPSVSGQHAVVQFRWIEKVDEFGDRKGRVKPYLIDLESANGTVLNEERVPVSRYLELRSKDVVKFGSSTREYVFVRGKN